MRSYKLYNLMMLLSCVFFAFGSVWIWRGEWAVAQKEGEMNKIEALDMIKKDAENNDSRTKRAEALPARINLDAPFTSQAPEKDWGQPWQDACEEAALLMLDAYYKKYNLSPLFAKDEIIKMVEWEETRNFGRSIEIENIAKIWDEYFVGLLKHENIKTLKQAKVIENPTVGQIKQSVAGGHPVLVVADGKVLPNPHFRNGGPVYHSLIIRGYDEDEFITNDPGTQFGKNFKYKYDDLMNAIHEWNGGDVKNGRKVVLVIE